jgi:small subunit ribosomal protein SAe
MYDIDGIYGLHRKSSQTTNIILISTAVSRPIMSSKLPSVLSATDEEIQLLLAAQCHIGTKNCDKQMEPYVWKRRVDG